LGLVTVKIFVPCLAFRVHVAGSVPSTVSNCANAQYHHTICAVKSHSRAL